MSEEKTTLLIVGKAGNGKSSTGNSILPRTLFSISHSFTSEDVECQAKEMDNIRVVCAPDLQHKKFIDPKFDEVEEVTKWSKKTKGKTDAVILVIRCNKRFIPEEFQAYEQLKKVEKNSWLADAIRDNLVIVFTAGDRLNGRDLRQDLESDKFPELVKKMWKEAQKKYVVFNNTAKGASNDIQVKALMDVVKTKAPHPFPQHICRLLFVGPKETLKTVWTNLGIRGDLGIFGHFGIKGLQLEVTFYWHWADENEPTVDDKVKVAVSPGPHAIVDLADGKYDIKALFGSSENVGEKSSEQLTSPIGKFILEVGIDKLKDRAALAELLEKDNFPARRSTMRGEFFRSDELGKIAEKICEETMMRTESVTKPEESSYSTYLLVKKGWVANDGQ